jgi:glucosylceramidase
MKLNTTIFLAGAILLVAAVFISCEKEKNGPNNLDPGNNGTTDIEYWLTTKDQTSLFQKVDHPLLFKEAVPDLPVIEVDTTQRFQSIDGFGYSLTGGSAYLLHEKLNASKRNELLQEVFSPNGVGIGVSYLRVSIGASDLDDHVFSYNDLPSGQTDASLTKFSLEEDKKHLIPVLKEIIAISPEIKIMGSPWSAPPWMKTNNSTKGGSLKPEYYEAYALYFVKYIQGMTNEGINIDAITIQNEPENPNNNPSMVMTAEEQSVFIKKYLGPAFEKAGIKTRIVIFDHNCDHPNYPIDIMNDPDAKKYIDGTAFHLYLGEIEALSAVQKVHPDKNLYFTEQWTSSEGKFDEDLRWHVKHLIVGATRNWARNVLEWNLASDPQFNPHTDQGGCTMCKGALTIGNEVTRNVSYYIIAHASKFVRPGSVRVGSGVVSALHNVAFVAPNGKKVLVVINDSETVKKFALKFKGKSAEISLAAGGVGTFVW